MYSNVAKNFFKGALDVVAETIWPTRCAVCECSGEKVLCDRCKSALYYVDVCRACPTCGAPFGYIQCTECNDVMLEKRQLEVRFDKTFSSGLKRENESELPASNHARTSTTQLLPYRGMNHALIADDAAKSIVRIYKDHDEWRLASDIAALLARYVSPDRIREKCTLTFIPSTKAALRRRGFDHAELICRTLAQNLGLECVSLFERPVSSDQRTLGRRERAANMRAVISVKKDMPLPYHVMIVDDICTTGATITSAAWALKDAGATHVYALTFGKVLD